MLMVTQENINIENEIFDQQGRYQVLISVWPHRDISN